ncbi:hypothetical protein SUGI_1521890 [Cryptomeria japonica]|uniref:RNase H type-1 domain-containing protein n=1 Tax=Cryptomeria japonica TaxID=3369 RepID=A0AAD3RQJ2_CRYJA|nr:hypothetical protein SUGI_1521890 [Cryptomeria japonica]
MVISRIKVSIAKVVNRKLAGKKVKAYTWWDKKMEEKWEILKVEMVGAIVRRDKRQSIKWKVPERNCYKFNFDGARKGNPRDVGFGAIIWDHDGKMLSATMGYMGWPQKMKRN